MHFRKFGLAAGLFAAGLAPWNIALAVPQPWETGFQPAASPVMENIEDFHRFLLYITVATCVLVFALLAWIAVRYNQRRNPVPGSISHNTLLEVVWTIVPVVILVVIAIPSFKLLYYEADIPPPDLTIKAIGKQWFWTYQYPTPAFRVKMDDIPGRAKETWFKAEREGTYYGECSELCGARHAFMPIEVKVVSQDVFNAWLQTAKKKFVATDFPGPRASRAPGGQDARGPRETTRIADR